MKKAIASLTVCALFSGCTTVVVPTAVACPVPTEFMTRCLDPDKRIIELLEEEDAGIARLTDSGDPQQRISAVNRLLRNAQMRELLWQGSHSACVRLHFGIAEMIAACNKNAQEARSKIF